jgi:Domain of unknown function (DUF1735)/Domain of unknown function (DUF4361)
MIKYLKYIQLSSIAIVILSLSACLKEDDIPNLSKVSPVIEFPLGGPGLKGNILSAFSSGPVDTAIALNIASPDPLNYDVTVTVKADAAAVASYNAANGTSYEALPGTLFTLESAQIVIKAGYRIGRVKVKIKFDQFDLSKKYMLALAITDAPGLIVSGNFGKFLWSFVVKNPYEGNYKSTGQIVLYNGPDVGSGIAATRNFTDRLIAASTINATTIETIMADLGNVMNLQVNAGNTVTVSPASANSFTIVENNGSCTYNPATKTFVLHYRYFNGAGNLREITQTMVKQ